MSALQRDNLEFSLLSLSLSLTFAQALLSVHSPYCFPYRIRTTAPHKTSVRWLTTWVFCRFYYKHTNRENNAKRRRSRSRRRVFGRISIFLTSTFIRMEATPYKWFRQLIKLDAEKLLNNWVFCSHFPFAIESIVPFYLLVLSSEKFVRCPR